jgi:hypothetical protein
MPKPHSYSCLLALVVLSVLVGSRPAIAQRRGGAAHVQGPKAPAAAHGNAAAAQFRQMQKQEQQYQKALMQQQAQMAKMQHQAQKPHPQGKQGLEGNASSATHQKKGHHRVQPTGTTHDSRPGQANPQAQTAATTSTPSANPTQPNATTIQPNGQRPQASATAQTSQLQQNPATTTPTSVLAPGPVKPAGTVSTPQPPQNPQSTTTPPTTTTTTTTTPPTTGTPVTANPHHRVGGGIGMVGAYNRLPWAMDQGMISLLRTAHARLQQADHDYQGHRARAANHVVSALRHLGAPGLPGSGIAPGVGRLPQAQSDGYLRDALFRLNQVQNELGTRVNRVAHHGSARSQVSAAIGEINLALSIR